MWKAANDFNYFVKIEKNSFEVISWEKEKIEKFFMGDFLWGLITNKKF
jgi:hypothetical protein